MSAKAMRPDPFPHMDTRKKAQPPHVHGARRCPYGCTFCPACDPYHVEACREAAKP